MTREAAQVAAARVLLWRVFRPKSAACRDYDWLSDEPDCHRCTGVLRAWLWRGLPCWCSHHEGVGSP